MGDRNDMETQRAELRQANADRAALREDMAAARLALGARAGETLPEAAARVRSDERERCAALVDAYDPALTDDISVLSAAIREGKEAGRG